MTTFDRPATVAPSAGRLGAWGRTDAVDGVRAMLPWLLGIAPFGLVVGMTARANDLSPVLGVLTGTTITWQRGDHRDGAARVHGVAVAVVVVSVLAINARLLLYGSSIAPHWQSTDRRFASPAAYLLVEPPTPSEFGDMRTAVPPRAHAFYLGGALDSLGVCRQRSSSARSSATLCAGRDWRSRAAVPARRAHRSGTRPIDAGGRRHRRDRRRDGGRPAHARRAPRRDRCRCRRWSARQRRPS